MNAAVGAGRFVAVNSRVGNGVSVAGIGVKVEIVGVIVGGSNKGNVAAAG